VDTAVRVPDGLHRLTQGVVDFYLAEQGGKLIARHSSLDGLAGRPGDLWCRGGTASPGSAGSAEAVRLARLAGRS